MRTSRVLIDSATAASVGAALGAYVALHTSAPPWIQAHAYAVCAICLISLCLFGRDRAKLAHVLLCTVIASALFISAQHTVHLQATSTLDAALFQAPVRVQAEVVRGCRPFKPPCSFEAVLRVYEDTAPQASDPPPDNDAHGVARPSAEDLSDQTIYTRIYLRDGQWSPLPGDVFESTGTLRRPLPGLHRFAFDPRTWSRRQGIDATFQYKDTPRLREVRPRFNRRVDQRRAFLEHAMMRPGRDDASGILVAMSTGTKSGISDEIRARFAAAGTAHVLAVSGLHLGLLAGVLWWTLTRVFRRFPRLLRRWNADALSSLITLPILAIYIVFTGMPTSAMRAGWMAAALLVPRIFARRGSSLHGLCLAILVLLAQRPLLIVDLGFQLSVSATLSLVLLARQIKRRRDALKDEEALQEAEKELAEHDEAHTLGFVFGQLDNPDETDTDSAPDAAPVSDAATATAPPNVATKAATYEEWNTQDFIATAPIGDESAEKTQNLSEATYIADELTQEAQNVGKPAPIDDDLAEKAQVVGDLASRADNPCVKTSESTDVMPANDVSWWRARRYRCVRAIKDLGHRLRPAFFWTLTAMEVSVVSTLATAPFLVWTFGGVPLLSPLPNLVVVPPLSLVALPMGVAGAVIHQVWPTLGTALIDGSLWVIDACLQLARAGEMIFEQELLLGRPATLGILGWALVAAASPFLLRGWQRKWWAAALCGILCIGVDWHLRMPPNDILEIHAIPVGQGDATWIRLPGKRSVLIDAGGVGYGPSSTGTKYVLPYLRAHGVKHVDILVGTHGHADHLNGITELVPILTPTHIWVGEHDLERTVDLALFDAAKAHGAAYAQPHLDWKEITIGETSFEIMPMGNTDSINDGSLVMRLCYRDFCAMLTGDMEAPREAFLVAQDRPLQAQYLKVGHHGSQTSTTEAFLQRVRPQVAVLELGVNNRFGFPHAPVMERLQQHGVRTWRTDRGTSIVHATDGHRLWRQRSHLFPDVFRRSRQESHFENARAGEDAHGQKSRAYDR